MYEVIMAGTNGTSHAQVAVDHAAHLASLCGARLYVAMVTVPESAEPIGLIHLPVQRSFTANTAWRGEADRVLRGEATRLARLNIEVETVHLSGDPVEALRAAAQQYSADLLVVGQGNSHGQWGTRHRSVSERLVPGAPCTLTVVHDK